MSTAASPAAAEQAAEQAARELSLSLGRGHRVAVVIGSGWAPALDSLGPTTAAVTTSGITGFAPPAVAGHAGEVRSIALDEQHEVLVFVGRTHLYEGRGVDAVAHPVRTAVAHGCDTIVLTNGCGGINPALQPGQAVLISDHINLTGVSPLTGADFVDLTDTYSVRLRRLCRELRPDLAEGVYVQFRGPQYETPAEIRMARSIGADLVGMSTAVEAIAAKAAGAEVLGISLVTNAAAGMTGQPLSHDEVLAAGVAAAHSVGELLAQVLRQAVV